VYRNKRNKMDILIGNTTGITMVDAGKGIEK
jgi:hypothetical protein